MSTSRTNQQNGGCSMEDDDEGYGDMPDGGGIIIALAISMAFWIVVLIGVAAWL